VLNQVNFFQTIKEEMYLEKFSDIDPEDFEKKLEFQVEMSGSNLSLGQR
jgi:hypothetical protein